MSAIAPVPHKRQGIGAPEENTAIAEKLEAITQPTMVPVSSAVITLITQLVHNGNPVIKGCDYERKSFSLTLDVFVAHAFRWREQLTLSRLGTSKTIFFLLRIYLELVVTMTA